MDRGACWAIVHGAAQSQTRLSDWALSPLSFVLWRVTSVSPTRLWASGKQHCCCTQLPLDSSSGLEKEARVHTCEEFMEGREGERENERWLCFWESGGMGELTFLSHRVWDSMAHFLFRAGLLGWLGRGRKYINCKNKQDTCLSQVNRRWTQRQNLQLHVWYSGIKTLLSVPQRRQWHPTPVLLPGKSHGRSSLEGCTPWVAEGRTWLSDFTFTFYFHALEKEMATHSSVLA